MSEALLADRYKLVRRIGEGGYGTVWLARDEQLRRDVAIKKLSVKDRSSEESQKKSDRFRHEAITMAKIDHANVVTIYDVGALADEQEIFLVMELLEGRSLLEELVMRGLLDRARALARFIEVLDGLQAAHDAGVVHKDLKPANMFLHRVDTPREQAKLIDFGIARMDSLTKLTGTGRMAGSPRYLAPEYIMGESVTPAIDIYQTALILVESLTGDPCVPQGLKYFDVCERHILSQLTIPQPLLDSPLGPVLDRALQRHPLDRFGSADEFAAALRKIRPEDLPTFDGDETVRMEVPKFDDELEVPSSEATVSGMVDRLREEEAALRPEGTTRRYVGIRSPEAAPVAPPNESPEDHIATQRLDISGPQQAPPLPPAEAGTTASGPQPVPRSGALLVPQPAESQRTRTQLRMMAAGALIVAIVVVGGSIIMRNVEGDPVVKNELPPSVDTCLLQCTQWYQDREVRGACQDLCRGTRPPKDPPFPLVDAIEPQFSEEVDEVEGPEAPTPKAEPEPQPEAPTAPDVQPAEPAPPSPKSKPTTSQDRVPDGGAKRPMKFAPVPQRWGGDSKSDLDRTLDRLADDE